MRTCTHSCIRKRWKEKWVANKNDYLGTRVTGCMETSQQWDFILFYFFLTIYIYDLKKIIGDLKVNMQSVMSY